MKVDFSGDTLLYNKKEIKPSIRKFSEMRPVLAYPEKDTDVEPELPTYYMYREADRFGAIRYDVTKIPSLDLCGERNKTFGHVHPQNKKGTGWPEVYEVIEGEAHFLLQRVGQMGVTDAVLLHAKAGDCFLVPPGYGHVTINPGKRDLVMGNLVAELFSADYSMFASRRGGCFYETLKGEFIRNTNYGTDFELRKEDARKFSDAFGVYAPFSKCDLVTAAKKKENIEFLEKPEQFY